MAHPNEDLLRSQDEAFSRGDLEGFFSTVHDDVVVHVSGNSSIAGDHRGIDAIKELFGRYMQALGDDPKVETHAILADDEHGVALQSVSARKGDREAEIKTANIYHFRDGKISELWTVDLDQRAADELYDA